MKYRRFIWVILLGLIMYFFQNTPRPRMENLIKQYQSDPSFRTRCNDAVRTAGRQAYRQHRVDRRLIASADISFCNYGFLIGIVESMLERSGSIAQAKRFCDVLKTKNTVAAHAYMECLKGIGMGTRSTDVCEKVSRNEEELNICVVGVMNAFAEDSFARGPLAKQGDPFGNCKAIAPRYQPQCYGSMAGMMIWSGRETFEGALALAQEIPDREGQIRAIRIIAKISMNKNRGNKGDKGNQGGDHERFIFGCRSLPVYLRWQCFISLVQGAMELGTPGKEWEDGFALCRDRNLTTDEKDICIPFVLYQIEQVLYGKEKVNQICTTMEPSLAGYCHDYQKDFFSL